MARTTENPNGDPHGKPHVTTWFIDLKGGAMASAWTRIVDPGAAYAEAVVEYIVRGGDPDQLMARCPVCDLVNVGPGHHTPIGRRCSFGWGLTRVA